MSDNFLDEMGEDFRFDVGVDPDPVLESDPVLEQDPEPTAAETIIDYTVEYGGRVFRIEEPDMQTVVRFLNVIGLIGLRAEKYVGQMLKGVFTDVVNGKAGFAPPAETMLFGLMAVLDAGDIRKVGILALFGGGKQAEDEGSAFFKELKESDMRIAPLVKAVVYRIAQSEDLAEALGNLQVIRSVKPAANLVTSRTSSLTPSS